MRRLSLLAGLGLGLVLLAGCPKPPQYPNCKDDTTCSERGEVCINGQCQECGTDANCKQGFRCEANRCVPAVTQPECQDDAACGAGRICEAGTCAQAQCQAGTDCGSGQDCQRGRCVAGRTTDTDSLAGASQCDYSPVRFDFNEASLTGEARGRLDQLAACLKGGKGRVTLEGHADERGTEEYNLQLSNRRAASVKRYLSDLGVPDGRLTTVGYGETRPANSGSGEAAWSENRRVEFVTK
jgi:peptidoglycan-associated lipoprotein